MAKSRNSAQEITEILVLRYAKKHGLPALGMWWNDNPTLKKIYKKTIIGVHAFLKIYSPQAIINALTKRKECKWQYTLYVPGVSDIIAEEQLKIDSIQKAAEKSEKKEFNTNTKTEIREFGPESKINKLRD